MPDVVLFVTAIPAASSTPPATPVRCIALEPDHQRAPERSRVTCDRVSRLWSQLIRWYRSRSISRPSAGFWPRACRGWHRRFPLGQRAGHASPIQRAVGQAAGSRPLRTGEWTAREDTRDNAHVFERGVTSVMAMAASRMASPISTAVHKLISAALAGVRSIYTAHDFGSLRRIGARGVCAPGEDGRSKQLQVQLPLI